MGTPSGAADRAGSSTGGKTTGGDRPHDNNSTGQSKSYKSLTLRGFHHRRRQRTAQSHVRSSNGLDLWDVCEKGVDLAYVVHTIELFPGLIHLEQRGRTPLFIACRNGHTAMAAKLLQAGATDVDGRIYQATKSVECRALLQEYRVVERALSMGRSDKEPLLGADAKRSSTDAFDPFEEEEISCDTPQTANLSKAGTVSRKKTIPQKQQELKQRRGSAVLEGNEEEGDVEDEEPFSPRRYKVVEEEAFPARQFSACGGSLAVGQDDDDDEKDKSTENKAQFWMPRFQSFPSSSATVDQQWPRDQAQTQQKVQEEDDDIVEERHQVETPSCPSILSERPMKLQRSLLSDDEEEDHPDDEVIEDHIQRRSHCGLVAYDVPAKNDDSHETSEDPNSLAQQKLETSSDTTDAIPESSRRSCFSLGSMVQEEDEEVAPLDAIVDDDDVTPEPSQQSCFSFGQHSLADVAPLGAACSRTSTNTRRNSTGSQEPPQQQQQPELQLQPQQQPQQHQSADRTLADGNAASPHRIVTPEMNSFFHLPPKPSPSISFSSMESSCDDDEQSKSQAPISTAGSFARQRRLDLDSPILVEQAIECTFVPAEGSYFNNKKKKSFINLSPWRKQRSRDKNNITHDDDVSLASTANTISDEGDPRSDGSTFSTNLARDAARAVEMTLEQFEEIAIGEQIRREGLFKRSLLRRKVSELLQDTDSCNNDDDDDDDDDDDTSVMSSLMTRTRSWLSEGNETACCANTASCCL
jgi:hypothetical protein